MYHLAQLNIARAKYPLDSEKMKPFIENVPRINKLGMDSPGFIWIYLDESGTAYDTIIFDDPKIILNLTVWQSIESLKAFAYSNEHLAFLKRRNEWFEPFQKDHLVLWWIPKSQLPTLTEAKKRIEFLWEKGPSLYCFTPKKLYPKPISN